MIDDWALPDFTDTPKEAFVSEAKATALQSANVQPSEEPRAEALQLPKGLTPLKHEEHSTADLEGVADRIISVFNQAWYQSSPTSATAARLCLSILEGIHPPIDESRLTRILQLISQEPNILNEFVRTARHKPMWEFLRGRGVTWDYVLARYEPDLKDHIEVFAGFAVGVGASIAETVRLPLDVSEGLYVLTGSLWSDELAKRRDEFFAAVKRLLIHPYSTATEMLQRWQREFEDHIVGLRFFQAGAMVGKIVLDVVQALEAAPKSIRSIGGIVGALRKLNVGELRRLVSLQEVAAFIRGRKARVVTKDGKTLETAGSNVVVRDPDGQPLGRFEPGDCTKAELDEWEKTWDESLEGRGDERSPPPSHLIVIDPEAVVKAAEEGLARRRLEGENIVGPQAEGRILHEEAKKFLDEHFAGNDRVLVSADRRLGDVLDMPDALKEMSVEDFLKIHPEIRATASVPTSGKILGSKLVNLKPDLLVLDRLTGDAIIWDLAPDLANPHFRKTLLYKEILERISHIKSVRVAETHYRRPIVPVMVSSPP